MNGRTNRRLGQLLLYIPEVVRVLVQLKAVPIVNQLLVQLNMLQLNAVQGDIQVMVQLIAVPEVDYQKLIDFWYSTAVK